MMDTLLNVGITGDNCWWWEEQLGKACFTESAERLNKTYQQLVGANLPDTFEAQLAGAIGAVFSSWNSERAKAYRKMHGYPDDWGTAVTVQSMVFGNLNTESCSGVLFTRDPATGENFVTGEFLPQAQGEDVVAGIRTPRALHLMEDWNEPVLDELLTISGKLEDHYKDAQDIEFTVQSGKLWILQTRNAKRTAEAAFRIAHDLAVEKQISKADAVRRVTGAQYAALLRSGIDAAFKEAPTLTGLAASPGVVSGPAAFDPAKVKAGDILIRKETSPDDFPAMVKAAAILTSTGGATSHAAVVARGINKPAVVGATDLSITAHGGEVVNGAGVVSILPGDLITLDGATGRVWVRVPVPVTGGQIPAAAKTLVEWAVQSSRAMPVVMAHEGMQVPAPGRYYVNVSAMTKVAQLKALFKALAANQGLSGVVGFERPAVIETPEDKAFLSLLAAATPEHGDASADQIAALVKVLASTQVPKKLRKLWQVHFPMTATEEQIELATDNGWSVVRPVRTLADLLAANGPVVFGPDFRERMKVERVKLDDIFALLSKAGRHVSEFGAVVEEKELVNEVLGK